MIYYLFNYFNIMIRKSFFPVFFLHAVSPSEPKPLPDLQCEDSWQSLLHGCSLSWSHEDLDGCDRHRRRGIHPVHGVVKGQDLPKSFNFLWLLRLRPLFTRWTFFKRLDGFSCHLCWRSSAVYVVFCSHSSLELRNCFNILSASFARWAACTIIMWSIRVKLSAGTR